MKNLIEIKLKIAVIALVIITTTSVVATRFSLEPAIFYPSKENKEECEKRGIDHRNCDNIEFLNFAWGDSVEYFKIAMGEDSYPPYSLRPLYPKFLGFLAKIGQEENIDKAYLFDRISKINYNINILCVFLLAIIPFLGFFHYVRRDVGFSSLVIALNVITFGVIQTSSFFMLDIVSYVIFSLAALVFFKRKLLVLSIISCIGIFVKDVSIILLLPLFFLYMESNEYQIKATPNLFWVLLPIIVFMGLRYFMKEDLLSVQYGWNITKGEVKANYLKMHLGGIKNIILFSQKVLVSIGGYVLMIILLFNFYRKEKLLFLTIIILIGSVIFANIILASRVPRVLSILIPFMVFYVLYVMDKIEKSK